MNLPESFKEELKARNDIVDVMSSYVEIKRAGRDHVCSCPFHSEKTPSCHIFTETQSFYCFGCHAGGDVIQFIRLIEHCEFMESVRILADRAGMSLPEDGVSDGVNMRARLLAMNREAARYYRDVLLSPEGREGLDYLMGRQLTPNTIRKYGLGFAPDGWHNLHYFLRQKGYTEDEMEAGALLVRNNNSLYDKFRRRVMFPIIDRSGNVIAFGGRTLEPTAPAKYLNSDETIVFHKRESLFSINFAKNTKEKFLILCEGYMDVIMLNQAGFDSAVATLGTAITPQQANLMKRYAGEVKISYDADSAGQNAVMKAINLLNEAGVKASVLVIPDAKDPDEYIKRFGAESFRQILMGTKDALKHEFSKAVEGIDTDTTEGKAEYLEKAIEFIAQIRKDTQRSVYESETARVTGQPLYVIHDFVIQRMKRNAARTAKNTEREIIRGAVKRDAINPEAMNFPREEKAERGIIAYLFHSPDCLPHIEKRLSPEDFPTEFHRRVYTFTAENIKAGYEPDLTLIGSAFTAEETSRVTDICCTANALPYTGDRLDEYIRVLAEHRQKVGEKPVTQLSDDELLDRMEEMRRRKRRPQQ